MLNNTKLNINYKKLMSLTLFINDSNVEVAMEDIVLKKAGKLECYLDLLSFSFFTKMTGPFTSLTRSNALNKFPQSYIIHWNKKYSIVRVCDGAQNSQQMARSVGAAFLNWIILTFLCVVQMGNCLMCSPLQGNCIFCGCSVDFMTGNLCLNSPE